MEIKYQNTILPPTYSSVKMFLGILFRNIHLIATNFINLLRSSVWFDFFSFISISTFMGYLMLKQSLLKNSTGTI